MNVYHYTFGHKMARISQTGALIPTTVNLGTGERPVLWFSHNAAFEPTATKGTFDEAGKIRLLTFDEMHTHLGIYRFVLGVPYPRLIPWARLPKLAKIPKRTLQHMIDEGIRRGAKPTDWVGTFVPVPLTDTKVELWDGKVWAASEGWA